MVIRLHVEHRLAAAPASCRLPLHAAGPQGWHIHCRLNKQMSFTCWLQERELVYDYSWYSCMAAADPASCCFATTCRVGTSAVPPGHTCTAAQILAHAVHTSATHSAVLHLHFLAAASFSKLVLELAGVAGGLAGHQTVSQQL